MELEVVVELVIVPVCAAHLQAALSWLSFACKVAITYDIREVVASGPMLRSNA